MIKGQNYFRRLEHPACRAFAWLILGFFLVSGYAAAGETAAAILDQLEKTYAGKSFFTDFSQISTLKVLDITETASGTAWFSHPGKMKWLYTTPDRHEIITNGRNVWIYRPDQAQVMVGQADRFFRSGAGGAFLSDIGLIRKSFQLTIHATDPAWVELALDPKQEQPAGQDSLTILIRISRKTHEITRVTTVNGHGDTTLFEFTGIRFSPLSSGFFEFTIPEGTSIMEME